MAKSKIEWTDKVWNPVTGCTKVSQGCKNCYAEGIARRFWDSRKFTDIQIHPDRLEQPLRWIKPSQIFVNSMSDLFHGDIAIRYGESFIDEVFAIMAATPRHTYQVLTKRATVMERYLSDKRRDIYVEHALETIYGEHGWCPPEFTWPLPNVWIGVSAENQETADDRIPLLLQAPAAVRFLSCEPLLEKVDITGRTLNQVWINDIQDPLFDEEGTGVDWIIAGCESGPHARPADPDWFRSLRDQCQAAGVPFFLKQMMVNGKLTKLPALDGKVWKEFPDGT